MQWKGLVRSVCCLLVVCVLLFNMVTVPVKAASVAVAVGTAVAALAVGAVFIGLGVLPGASPVRFESAVSDCVADLSLKGLVVDGMVYIAHIGQGVQQVQALTSDFVDSVREWLFDAQIIEFGSSWVGSALSVSTLSGVFAYGMTHSIDRLVGSNPANTMQLLRDLGVSENVLILSVLDSVMYGLFFGADGRLYSGSFVNPFGVAHVSVFGMHALSDLVAVLDPEEVHVVSRGSTNTGYSYPIFYSEAHLLSDPNFLTMDALVVNWSSLPSLLTAINGSQYSSFSFFRKKSSDSVISDVVSYGLSDLPTFGAGIGSFEWSLAASLGVVAGLSAGVIGNLAEDLSVAYPSWVDNAVVVDGKQLGKEDKEYLVYPFPGVNTMDDVLGLTQEEVWAGSSAKPITGTFADTAVGSFLDALMDALLTPLKWLLDQLLAGLTALFVPSSDYLSAKVEALRAEFAFADGIISTAEIIRDIFNDSGQEPPVIYIDLGATRGSYNIGGEIAFVDMSWYAEYKPTVDKLLSGLIWLVFCWQSFKRLPGIISGLPGDFVMDGITVLGLEDRLPSRKAAYEIHRASIRQSIRGGK